MMQFKYLHTYYRIGRFIFALTLTLAFQMAGVFSVDPRLIAVLGVYVCISFLRLAARKEQVGYFDFLLDAVFVSVVIYVSILAHSYLTLMYLFPLFLASLAASARHIFIFPTAVSFLYGAAIYLREERLMEEHFVNIALHIFAFFLVSVAGNAVKDRMKRQEQYIQQLEEEKERMQGFERMYRVSADLAHELRNPLASISGAVQFLREGTCDKELVEMISAETRRLTNLVNDFLMYSRPADAPSSDVDMGDLLKTMFYHIKSDRQIDVQIADNVIVLANRTFLEAAVNNILINALEASQTRVRVTLETVDELLQMEHIASGFVLLKIEDDGPGIRDEIVNKIFEPFMTTKAKGTGLGLTIAYRIINSYGGKILVGASNDLGGAKFTVILPLKG